MQVISQAKLTDDEWALVNDEQLNEMYDRLTEFWEALKEEKKKRR